MPAALNSILVAGAVAIVAVVLSLVLAYAGASPAGRAVPAAIRLAGMGYALRGRAGDRVLSSVRDLRLLHALCVATSRLGFGTGLILSGTLFALVFALTTRFLTVALGNIEAGLQKVSPNLDAAARTLGETPLSR